MSWEIASGGRGFVVTRDDGAVLLESADESQALNYLDLLNDSLCEIAAKKDPKKPYGAVMYADPGYRDNTKRYPCDTPDHVRAAISYVSMPKNAAMYTPEQLKAMKSRIRAAAKRFGIETDL